MEDTTTAVTDQRFKTLRHIETVRNYLNHCIKELLHRQEEHDQSKLQSPEREIFDEYTPKLRDCTYGSEEYQSFLKEMQVALDHHYAKNRHHPEHHKDGIRGMTLIDLVEMICDWKAATLRHADGNILKSVDINAKRFNYSEDLRIIMENTAKFLDESRVSHHAEES